MRFREVLRTPVVDITTAETIGEVSGFTVALDARRVAGTRLGRIKGKRTFLAWEDLWAFGRDAVTVEGADRLRPAEDHDPGWVLDTEMFGRRVLSFLGSELGEVADVEFDPATGRVTGVLATEATVPAERILGFGSYALVAEVDPPAGDGAAGESGGGSGTGHAPRPLEEWTREELYARAQELDVEGRSSMSKEQLMAALRERAGG